MPKGGSPSPIPAQTPEELQNNKKTCISCGGTKALYEFYVAMGSAFGRTPRCKKCMLPEKRAWREKQARKSKRQKREEDAIATPQEKVLTEWWFWDPTRFGPLPPWRRK